MSQSLIDAKGLKAKGVNYSPSQLFRKEKLGTFPKRVYLSANRVAWVEQEIDEYVASLIAARQQESKAA